MKPIASVLLIVIILALVTAGSAYNCPTDCNGCTPVVMCDETKHQAECDKECARACGMMTNYRSDKGECSQCSTWCGGYGADCEKACKNMCDLNGQIYSIVDIVYGIAAGIAALMIVLHGFKWLISEEPAERKEARERIIYVILGLIVIMIAVALVNFLYRASVLKCA